VLFLDPTPRHQTATEADLTLPPDRFLGRRLRHFLDPEVAARLEDAIGAALHDHHGAHGVLPPT
jgi:hypothetical protein